MKNVHTDLKEKPNLPDPYGRKWFKGVCICVGLIGIGVVSFLSLRSSSALNTIWWMPKPIAQWADRHGRFCNFPAYGLMGVPFFMLAKTLKWQLRMFIILSLLIVSLEIAQLAIPTRHCDIWDMFWGCSGLVVTWVICVGIKKLRLT